MAAGSLPLVCAVALLVAGCGSDRGNAPSTTASPTTGSTATSTTSITPAGTTTGPSALQAEAKSAATGDIPDSQVFIRFRDAGAGYSLKYPEGWAQRGSAAQVTFRDKNNIVRVIVSRGALQTATQIRAALRHLGRSHVQSGPQKLRIAGAPAIKVVYTTTSAPNPVTGKRVTLQVDRYYLSRAGKEAIVDLGTPVGVDNLDAYRLMIDSFRWK
jgi:hypothetical protein